jgi:hypothetical protein
LHSNALWMSSRFRNTCLASFMPVPIIGIFMISIVAIRLQAR